MLTFDRILKMQPKEVECQCLKLTLSEIGEVLKEAAELYPFLKEDNPRLDKDKLEIGTRFGMVFKVAKKLFDREQKAASKDNSRWIKLERECNSETWHEIKGVALKTLGDFTKEYELQCRKISKRLKGDENWFKYATGLSNLFATADFLCEQASLRDGVSSDCVLAECEWARRRLSEKYALSPNSFKESKEFIHDGSHQHATNNIREKILRRLNDQRWWQKTDDDLIEEVAVFCANYFEDQSGKK